MKSLFSTFKVDAYFFQSFYHSTLAGVKNLYQHNPILKYYVNITKYHSKNKKRKVNFEQDVLNSSTQVKQNFRKVNFNSNRTFTSQTICQITDQTKPPHNLGGRWCSVVVRSIITIISSRVLSQNSCAGLNSHGQGGIISPFLNDY